MGAMHSALPLPGLPSALPIHAAGPVDAGSEGGREGSAHPSSGLRSQDVVAGDAADLLSSEPPKEGADGGLMDSAPEHRDGTPPSNNLDDHAMSRAGEREEQHPPSRIGGIPQLTLRLVGASMGSLASLSFTTPFHPSVMPEGGGVSAEAHRADEWSSPSNQEDWMPPTREAHVLPDSATPSADAPATIGSTEPLSQPDMPHQPPWQAPLHRTIIMAMQDRKGLERKAPKHSPTHLTTMRQRLQKSNSCSTLFVDSTLVNADLHVTLQSTACYLVQLLESHRACGFLVTRDIYSERLHPLSPHIRFYRQDASEDQFFRFLEFAFSAAELRPLCAIMMLAYLERHLACSGITLHESNWARLLLGVLILASKVWDDHAVWNVDFTRVFPDVAVIDFNELEKDVLETLQFDVSVKASAYATYYFSLRDIAEAKGRPWPDRPLTLQDMSVLEVERFLLHLHQQSRRRLSKSTSTASMAEGEERGSGSDGGSGRRRRSPFLTVDQLPVP